MSWVLKNDLYCVNSFFYDMNIPHCITTKKASNIRNPKFLERFLNTIKTEDFFCNWDNKPIFSGTQIHGDNIYEIQKNIFRPGYVTVENTDALYSVNKDALMLVFTADCIPVFIISKDKKIKALAHAGWRGVFNNIVGKTIIEIKKKYFTSEFFVVFGPHLKKCCYEVGKEFQKFFKLDQFVIKGQRRFFLDMEKHLILKLKELGIKQTDIFKSNYCTGCNNDLFFSYRFDNKTDSRIGSFLG
ncbi:peptidoglycan editing factor PgeF [bacterium]